MDDKPKNYKPQAYSALVGSGVAAAILTLNPIKQFFFTREEGNSNTLRIEKVEAAQDDFRKQMLVLNDKMATENKNLREDLALRLERATDKILEVITKDDAKLEKVEQRLNERIDRIELLIDTKPILRKGR